MRTNMTTLLVGMHFRPPAKTLLENLPAGVELRLEKEPDNPYDENAIKVLLRSEDIPHSRDATLEEVLPSSGFTLEEVRAVEEWQLGYVAATGGKPLLGTNYVGNKEVLEVWPCEATLDFDVAGKPILRLAAKLEG